MKKTLARRHARHKAGAARKPSSPYVVVVRGWMFLVAFALMLGLGAVVGNFVNEQLNQTTPQVAGASTQK